MRCILALGVILMLQRLTITNKMKQVIKSSYSITNGDFSISATLS